VAASFQKPAGDPRDSPWAPDTVELPDYLLPLQDKFEFLEKLGGGGFGEVWRVRVRNSVLDVERAVKVIRPEAANNREYIERMVREAQAMARLKHPHAVTVHFASRDPAYIEMDYISGKTLETVLKEHGPCHRMSLDWTAQFLDQLCSVLQLAHKNHIIHRDLKPSNLMLADGGAAEELDLRVLDFGIAKVLNAAPGAFKTMGNAPLTPQYTSPEQAREDVPLDARSDIFAVGLILYQLLTGRHPFWSPGDSIYSAMAAIFDKPAPRFQERNPDACVPESIEHLVLRCLEKGPAQRPESAAALAAEFHRLVLLSRPRKDPVPPEPVPPIPQGWPRLRFLIALVVATLGAFLAIGVAPWLSIKPVHDHLVIRAGTSNTIDFVTFATDNLSRNFTLNVVEPLPEGIKVEAPPSTDGVQLQFRVEIIPEFVPDDKPVRQEVAFNASLGRLQRRLTVALEIRPPDLVRLPRHWHWVRSPTSKLRRINEKYYPEQIERKLGGDVMVALLIDRRDAKPGADEFPPFYIMKDKVWVGLFEVFAREQPNVVRDAVWRQGSDLRRPVCNVTGPQAEAFAEWLAGPGQGALPTEAQWDQAAGRNLVNPRSGPFERWDPSDSNQVAVGLEAPVPVDRPGNRDVSPYGCRDMSGNGWEWIRHGDEVAVTLRGQSFKEAKPFMFDDIDKKLLFARDFGESDSEIGFRVVIKLDSLR
jgi:serine/threonine protein kinase